MCRNIVFLIVKLICICLQKIDNYYFFVILFLKSIIIFYKIGDFLWETYLFLWWFFSVSLFARQYASPLMEALERRDVKKAVELINLGADINIKDRMGETPLIEAAEKGLTEVVQLLVDKKVNLNVGNVRNRTALSRASSRGHVEIVRILVNAGADINIKDKYGKSALNYASERNHKEIVSILKNAGAR